MVIRITKQGKNFKVYDSAKNGYYIFTEYQQAVAKQAELAEMYRGQGYQ